MLALARWMNAEGEAVWRALTSCLRAGTAGPGGAGAFVMRRPGRGDAPAHTGRVVSRGAGRGAVHRT
jgi:hypothetical protein